MTSASRPSPAAGCAGARRRPNILALGGIQNLFCFIESREAAAGGLDASRFTPRSSLIRLCGSSATLKAGPTPTAAAPPRNCVGPKGGATNKVRAALLSTTKPKFTPYASAAAAAAPPASTAVRAGKASPTAFYTLEAHSPHLSPPRAAARPSRRTTRRRRRAARATAPPSSPPRLAARAAPQLDGVARVARAASTRGLAARGRAGSCGGAFSEQRPLVTPRAAEASPVRWTSRRTARAPPTSRQSPGERCPRYPMEAAAVSDRAETGPHQQSRRVPINLPRCRSATRRPS